MVEQSRNTHEKVARTVYLVDDDQAVRDSLSFLLELYGFEVHGFASCEEFLGALEAGATEGKGSVVLDVQMPGMSGLEFLHLHRERLKGWRVIMISGHADEQAKAEARAAGALDFLDKPFADEALVEVLERAEAAA